RGNHRDQRGTGRDRRRARGSPPPQASCEQRIARLILLELAVEFAQVARKFRGKSSGQSCAAPRASVEPTDRWQGALARPLVPSRKRAPSLNVSRRSQPRAGSKSAKKDSTAR